MCYGPQGTRVTWRRYYTSEEKAAWLEDYASALEKELAGVRERIAKLRSEAGS